MSMESEGKELLWRRLDASLRRHAKTLGNGDGLPDIADIYRVQEMAEIHCYLKTEHLFTPMEVNALLRFADPLEVAAACWEQNPDKYALDICKILDANDMFQNFAPGIGVVVPFSYFCTVRRCFGTSRNVSVCASSALTVTVCGVLSKT